MVKRREKCEARSPDSPERREAHVSVTDNPLASTRLLHRGVNHAFDRKPVHGVQHERPLSRPSHIVSAQNASPQDHRRIIRRLSARCGRSGIGHTDSCTSAAAATVASRSAGSSAGTSDAQAHRRLSMIGAARASDAVDGIWRARSVRMRLHALV